MPDLPDAPEQRTIDVDVQDVDTRGRTLVGYAAVYGAESGDLGGFTERIAPGAFSDVLAGSDVRCLLNHDPSQVLGRTRSGTLRLADEERGLRFECDLPDSPLGENVREAVRRGDVDGASFRFKVGRDAWEGRTRTVEHVAELHDVTVATYGAYPDASVELRTRNPEPEEAEVPEGTPEGGLRVEERAARPDEQPDLEARVVEAIRAVRKGESRSLTTANASAIVPDDVATFLWDRLRSAAVGLASGIRVIPTSRHKVAWPRLISDVDPTWVAELEQIPAGDPGFGTLEAEPHKLAHRVSPISNEVIDDSEPSIVDVLNSHLVTMLALKLDRSLFEGNPSADADSIRGLKFTPGIQTISMGTNGAALTDYDPLIRAVGRLRSANVPGPYVAVGHPDLLTELDLLKESADTKSQLARPDSVPPLYATSQLSTTETQGSASTARSIYVFAPGQVVLVRRKDAEIELDRSRLFDIDASEMRGKLRADLIVPNPVAVVRITGVLPPA